MQGGPGLGIQRSVSGTNLYSLEGEAAGQMLHRPNTENSFKGSSSTIDQEYNSTPSPSDSAVGDLENVLKVKMAKNKSVHELRSNSMLFWYF